MGCCQVKSSRNSDEFSGLLVSNNDPIKPLLKEDHEALSHSGMVRRNSDLSRRRPFTGSSASDAISSSPPLSSLPSVVSGSFDSKRATLTRSATASMVTPTKPLPLQEQVAAKLQKKIGELPVPMDLPRMSNKIRIKVDGRPVPSALPEMTVVQRVRAVLIALAGAFELPDLRRNIDEKFDAFLPPGYEGDIARKLRPFLEEVIGEDNPVSVVLKCINQAMVAPAVLRMKSHLMNKLGYKDCRNQWDVDVEISHDLTAPSGKLVTVTHLKREQSVPEGFEFVWALKFIFSDDLTTTKDTVLTIPILEWTSLSDEGERARVQDNLSELGYDRTISSTQTSALVSPVIL